MYNINQNLTLLQIEPDLITVNNHPIITESETAHLAQLSQAITLAEQDNKIAVGNKGIGNKKLVKIETSGTFKSQQRQVIGGKDECLARWSTTE